MLGRANLTQHNTMTTKHWSKIRRDDNKTHTQWQLDKHNDNQTNTKCRSNKTNTKCWSNKTNTKCQPNTQKMPRRRNESHVRWYTNNVGMCQLDPTQHNDNQTLIKNATRWQSKAHTKWQSDFFISVSKSKAMHVSFSLTSRTISHSAVLVEEWPCSVRICIRYYVRSQPAKSRHRMAWGRVQTTSNSLNSAIDRKRSCRERVSVLV